MVILAGEIGKKTTTLALFTHKTDPTGKNHIIDGLAIHQTFETYKYRDSPESMIEEFLNQNTYEEKDIYGACFGIAGLVEDGTATIEHSDWKTKTFTQNEFRQKLSCKTLPLLFINDMVAIGYATFFLNHNEIKIQDLYTGQYKPKPTDSRVLMLVGDGLGQSLWYWDSKDEALRPMPSEGGHIDFAARTEEECSLARYLETHHQDPKDTSPVSYEMVLSKPGLIKIYKFFNQEAEPSDLSKYLDENPDDPSLIIKQACQENPDPICQKTVKMFVSMMGAQAGNLALTYMAKGGIFLGGIEIAFEQFREDFRQAFINKEKQFKKYNADLSVRVYDSNDIVLWGAAQAAIEKGFVGKGKFAILRQNQ